MGARTSTAVCAQAHCPPVWYCPRSMLLREIIETARQLDALEAQRRGSPGAIRLLVLATGDAAGAAWPCPLTRRRWPAPTRRWRASAGSPGGAEDLGAPRWGAGQARRGRLAHLHLPAGAQRLPARGGGAAATGHRHRVYRLSRRGRFCTRAGGARRDGFGGKLAIHPDQITTINAAFTPTEAERRHADACWRPSPPQAMPGWRAWTVR